MEVNQRKMKMRKKEKLGEIIVEIQDQEIESSQNLILKKNLMKRKTITTMMMKILKCLSSASNIGDQSETTQLKIREEEIKEEYLQVKRKIRSQKKKSQRPEEEQ